MVSQLSQERKARILDIQVVGAQPQADVVKSRKFDGIERTIGSHVPPTADLIDGPAVAKSVLVIELPAPVHAIRAVISRLEILCLADTVGTSHLNIASQCLAARESRTKGKLRRACLRGISHRRSVTCQDGSRTSRGRRGLTLDDHHPRRRVVGWLLHDDGGCGVGSLLDRDLEAGAGLCLLAFWFEKGGG